MSEEKIKQEAIREGAYEDIVIGGQTILKGWRDCESRWEIIKNHVGGGRAFLDLGSHYGYFSIKLALHNTDNIIWSIEADEKRVNIQKQILEKEGINNVALCHKRMELQDFLNLYRSSEGIDCMLALSVLHYFNPEEIVNILWLISKIAPNFIFEYPPVEEKKVANWEWVKEIGDIAGIVSWFYDSVDLIGETQSATDPTIKRPIYLAKRNKIFRTHCISYIAKNRCSKKRHYLVYFNNRWWFNRSSVWFNGFNLQDLFEFNLIYPNRDSLLDKASEEYLNLIRATGANVTDIGIRNIIFQGAGLKIIDYLENSGQDIYGEAWEKYRLHMIEDGTQAELKKLLELR